MGCSKDFLAIFVETTTFPSTAKDENDLCAVSYWGAAWLLLSIPSAKNILIKLQRIDFLS
jgi:hypothetical protein